MTTRRVEGGAASLTSNEGSEATKNERMEFGVIRKENSHDVTPPAGRPSTKGGGPGRLPIDYSPVQLFPYMISCPSRLYDLL